MKFSPKLLKKFYDDDKFIFEELEESGRWQLSYWGVFKYKDNKFYSAYWSVGATEYQDSDWFGYDDQDCPEMVEKEVIVKKWVILEDVKR